jgi:lincosamide nucleotidyltransferase A/C/D/E
MSARDARRLYELLERAGIEVWVDGGWAVDALLGEATRPHADLDVALETRYVRRLREVLAERGFREVVRDDASAWNFVLEDAAGLQVDAHAFTFDERGDGVYGPPENGHFYRAEALTGVGVIDGRRVRCISADWLVRFRTGYRWREKDVHDVTALCGRFGIPWPEPDG